MAKTIRTGAFLPASGGSGGISNPVHSNAGVVLALLISHTNASTTQSITLYDDTTGTSGNEIAVIDVRPGQSPTYIQFPRNAGIPFSTGLYINAGSCNVLVWSVDYG